MTENIDKNSAPPRPLPEQSLSQRVDALLADAEAGGALALEAARQAAALSASTDPQRYRRALRLAAGLDPFDPTPRIALARRLAEEGDIEEAKREAGQVVANAVDEAARAHAAFVLGEIARAQGEFDDARKHFEMTAAIETAVLNADPRDPGAARWHARAMGRLAELDAGRGDRDKARLRAEGALAMLRALSEQLGENTLLSADVADAELRMGAFDLDARNYPAAGQHLSEAIGRYELITLKEPDEPHWRGVLADGWALAAGASLGRNAQGAARNAMDKALSLRVKLASGDPRERWALAGVWRQRAALIAALGDPQGAVESLNQARALAEQLCGENPGLPDAARFLVHTLFEQSDLALRNNALETAQAAAAEARRWAELFAQATPSQPAWRIDLAASWERLGEAMRRQHAHKTAQDAFARAVALRRMVCEDTKTNSLKRGLAASLLKAGECALEAGDPIGARAAFAESMNLRLTWAEDAPNERAPARDLAVALERIGLAASAAGDKSAARGAWEQELALAERIFPDQYDSEGQRFRAVVEAHLASLGGIDSEAYRAAAIGRFDTLAREGRLSERDEAFRRKLWTG